MAQQENNPIDISHYQALVNQLAELIELRFGVYLDTLIGFQFNLEDCRRRQHHAIQTLQVSLEDLDKTHLIRGNGPYLVFYPNASLLPGSCKNCKMSYLAGIHPIQNMRKSRTGSTLPSRDN